MALNSKSFTQSANYWSFRLWKTNTLNINFQNHQTDIKKNKSLGQLSISITISISIKKRNSGIKHFKIPIYDVYADLRTKNTNTV